MHLTDKEKPQRIFARQLFDGVDTHLLSDQMIEIADGVNAFRVGVGSEITTRPFDNATMRFQVCRVAHPFIGHEGTRVYVGRCVQNLFEQRF